MVLLEEEKIEKNHPHKIKAELNCPTALSTPLLNSPQERCLVIALFQALDDKMERGMVMERRKAMHN